MTGDIVLSAAMRNNLSSLANTQTQIDKTQLDLSTGKKVNSALDNPEEYFQSQALNASASDLTNLLDSFSNSIQTVNAANNGITSLTSFVNQAQSIAQTAQTDVANGASVASATGTTDLSGVNDLTSLAGLNGGGTYKLVLSTTDKNGNAIDVGSYGATSASGSPAIALGSQAAITIGSNTSISDLINSINSLQVSNGASSATATGGQAFKASLNSSGQLTIASANGGTYTAQFEDTAGGATTSDSQGVASALGFSSIAGTDGAASGGATTGVKFTASSTSALNSNAFYVQSGSSEVVASRSSTLDQLLDSSGNNYFTGLDTTDGKDNLTISINGGSSVDIGLEDSNKEPVTVQNVIDSINNNTSLNTQVKAGFNDTTGQITLTALNSSVQTIQFGNSNSTGTAGASTNFGFGGSQALTNGGSGKDAQQTVLLGQANGSLASDQSDYNGILDQINQLVQDTGYQGVNLLGGNNLTTYFDANRTTSSTINGVDFSASGLGIKQADFSSAQGVSDSLNQLQSALTSIRSYGSSLANGLSTIQNRQTFTNSTISTLQTGANNLVDADTNEESANLLALQTSQSLGVDALSLASQSQQSVLKLFG